MGSGNPRLRPWTAPEPDVESRVFAGVGKNTDIDRVLYTTESERQQKTDEIEALLNRHDILPGAKLGTHANKAKLQRLVNEMKGVPSFGEMLTWARNQGANPDLVDKAISTWIQHAHQNRKRRIGRAHSKQEKLKRETSNSPQLSGSPWKEEIGPPSPLLGSTTGQSLGNSQAENQPARPQQNSQYKGTLIIGLRVLESDNTRTFILLELEEGVQQCYDDLYTKATQELEKSCPVHSPSVASFTVFFQDSTLRFDSCAQFKGLIRTGVLNTTGVQKVNVVTKWPKFSEQLDSFRDELKGLTPPLGMSTQYRKFGINLANYARCRPLD